MGTVKRPPVSGVVGRERHEYRRIQRNTEDFRAMKTLSVIK